MKKATQYQKLGRVGLRRLSGDPSCPHRLLCFPFLGGQSLSFRPLAGALPPTFEIFAVDPPGHGWIQGTPARSFEELVSIYAEALAPHLSERSYHLLGHSMGGIVAHRLAHQLEGSAHPPTNIFVTAAPLPHRTTEYEYLRRLDDRDLFGRLDAIGSMGGEDASQSQWFFELVMPAVRADLDILLSVRADRAARVTRPLWILYSQDDTFVPSAHMHEWRRYGERVRFEVTNGDHQFVVSRPADVARWITTTLAEADHVR